MKNIQIKRGHAFEFTWANSTFKSSAVIFSVDIVDVRFMPSGSITSSFQEKWLLFLECLTDSGGD